MLNIIFSKQTKKFLKSKISNAAVGLGLLSLSLSAALFSDWGCASNNPVPNPLANWNIDFKEQPSEAIEKDYHDYIQQLPANIRQSVGTVHFFEDGTGRHAINIEIGVNGVWWEHALIYDRDDKRIQLIKYRNGGYRS